MLTDYIKQNEIETIFWLTWGAIVAASLWTAFEDRDRTDRRDRNIGKHKKRIDDSKAE